MALAESLWDNRYVLFKAEERMSEEEKQQLSRIVETDPQVGRLRSFLGGVWRIFEDSTDEQQARAALAALKQMPVDRINSKPFEQVISFLEENFLTLPDFVVSDFANNRMIPCLALYWALDRQPMRRQAMEPSRGKSICIPFKSEDHYAICVADPEGFPPVSAGSP